MGLIVTASDIEAEQQRTLAAAQALDAAVQACAALDATTKSEWATFYANLHDFCSRPVCSFWYPLMPSNCLMATANTGDTMVAIERELQGWHGRIAPACPNVPPTLATFNPTPLAPMVSDWLFYGAIIAGAVGTAYVVSRVVPLIAPPKQLPPKG